VSSEKLALGRVRVKNSDTGAGISPKRQDRLFVAFEPLEADQSDVQGTGLGLVFSKKLMELMGGHIGVDSQPGREVPSGSNCLWLSSKTSASVPKTA
jgi:signal transduction histidine kinase